MPRYQVQPKQLCPIHKSLKLLGTGNTSDTIPKTTERDFKIVPSFLVPLLVNQWQSTANKLAKRKVLFQLTFKIVLHRWVLPALLVFYHQSIRRNFVNICNIVILNYTTATEKVPDVSKWWTTNSCQKKYCSNTYFLLGKPLHFCTTESSFGAEK